MPAESEPLAASPCMMEESGGGVIEAVDVDVVDLGDR